MNLTKTIDFLKKMFMLITFLLGLYFIYKSTSLDNMVEPFSSNNCPDLLIQKGNDIYLENTKRAHIPGVNPIKFKNLDEYTEFLKWQRSNQIRCPVLELQKSYDVQNEEVYSVRPSLSDPQGGLPNEPTYDAGLKKDVMAPFEKLLDAGRDDPPYNKNSYPGFDPGNQYIGLNVPLDKMYRKDNTVRAHEPSETK